MKKVFNGFRSLRKRNFKYYFHTLCVPVLISTLLAFVLYQSFFTILGNTFESYVFSFIIGSSLFNYVRLLEKENYLMKEKEKEVK